MIPGSDTPLPAAPAVPGLLPAKPAIALRRGLIRALVSLVVLFGLMLLVATLFDRELLRITHWVHRTLGWPGLAVIVFCADSLTAPIPPDLVLIVVAKTELSHAWAWWVPLAGVLSSFAGTLGWLLGKWLGSRAGVAPLLARFRARHAGFVERYAGLTVALGALTPLPFSITCWSAGAVGMPLAKFFPISLLRVPRYVAYYLAIAYADRIAQGLGG